VPFFLFFERPRFFSPLPWGKNPKFNFPLPCVSSQTRCRENGRGFTLCFSSDPAFLSPLPWWKRVEVRVTFGAWVEKFLLECNKPATSLVESSPCCNNKRYLIVIATPFFYQKCGGSNLIITLCNFEYSALPAPLDKTTLKVIRIKSFLLHHKYLKRKIKFISNGVK